MRVKDISSIIGKAGHLSICEKDGQQWIGDGGALYPVQGMPKLEDAEILRFLDLDPAKVAIDHITAARIDFSPENFDPESHLLDRRGPSFIDRGILYRSYLTQFGAVIAKEAYFKPIDKDSDMDCEPIYYLRSEGIARNRFTYIVAKKGLNVLGYIYPINYWTAGELRKTFSEFAEQMRTGAEIFGGHVFENEEE